VGAQCIPQGWQSPGLMMEDTRARRGVITKLFGVILIFLATLDGMLSWRGGIEISDFYLFLFAAGVFLFVLGVIRQGNE
jgi:hypothetical protein